VGTPSCKSWMSTYANERMSGRGLFFFEDEVGGCGAGGDLDPVGDTGWDVDDVSGVEGDFFSALDAGAQSFAGAAGAVVGVFSLHGAAGDEGDCAFVDDDLVGEELMTLCFACVEADYKEGVVVAVVFEPAYSDAGWTCLGGFDEFGFALLEVGGGVDDRVGGLGEEWGCCECERQEEATGRHAGSLGMANCNGWVWLTMGSGLGVEGVGGGVGGPEDVAVMLGVATNGGRVTSVGV
jgi:hypothetical protein